MSHSSDPLADAEHLVAAGRADEAIVMLQALLAAGRGGVLTRIALGRAHLACANHAAALAEFRDTMALAPGSASVALAMGEALVAAGHLPTGIAELERALRCDPALDAARHALAIAWLEAGEPDRALEHLSGLDDAAAAGLRAEAERLRGQERSPPNYVRHLFDQFSHDYDGRMLTHLHYQGHAILRGLADLVMGMPEGLRVLDLGCGTGLAGEAFKDIAGALRGVDLSPLMLEKAKSRGLYDALIAGDLETALEEDADDYDLVLAADTLVYLGALERVFAGVARRLATGGFFLFTVERKDGDGYELGPKRRYRHSESYIRALASIAGFEVAGLLACHQRVEAGMPVDGLAIALQRA